MRHGFVLALALACATSAGAQQPDAGWPCEAEPKQSLALSDSWPEGARAKVGDWAADAAVVGLATQVARRSLDQAEAVARVRAFAARQPGLADRAKLATAIVDAIDTERRAIIAGVRRFNTRQAQIAKRVEAGYTALDAPKLTPERKAALEDQAEWDQRIFEDRQRMLPIVCRQPAALETRLSALIGALKDPAK
jgi:hypothetical protein